MGSWAHIDRRIGTTFITLQLNLIHQGKANVLYLDAAVYIYIYINLESQ